MLERHAVESFLSHLRTLRVAGDADKAAEHFTDDAVFRISGFGEPTTGKAAIREALRGLMAEFAFLEFRPIHTLIDGDHVAMCSALKIRHEPSGRIVDTETFDFVTLKDGKIAAYHQYIDTRLAAELVAGQ